MWAESMLSQVPVKAIIYIAIVLVVLALLRGLYEHGEQVGYSEAAAKYELMIAQREKAQMAVLRASYEAALQKERDRAAAMELVITGFRARLKEVEHAKIVAVANAHTHGLYLQASCRNRTGTLPEAGAAPGGGDGAGLVRLSDKDAEFFLGFAAQCDAVATQLTSCQHVIEEDRR